MAHLAIYSASAGSGKTYTLTQEYLTLALAGDDAAGFKKILALTFTNAAASEMKKRIVESLEELAHAPVSRLRLELAQRLAEEGAFRGRGPLTAAEQEADVQRRAAEMFRRVLYDYADFAVGTLDSFGQRIVTTFARELGLPATFEVELDTTAVLSTAVGLLLDQVNRPDTTADPALSALLRQYAAEVGAEGRSLWGLAEEVAGFSKALFNDTHLDIVQHLTARDVAGHQQWRAQAQTYLLTLESTVETTAARALALIAGAGLAEEHFAHKSSGIYSYFKNALKKWQEAETPNSYARAAIAEDKWASAEGKKAPFAARLAGIQDELRGIYVEIEALRARESGGYLLLRAMQPHSLSVALLGEVQRLVTEISRERGVVLISEFNRRIAGVVLHEPVPFVYEKLGDRYQHLLVDEFQDTSALQWHNLLPLIENSLGVGHRSLVVGDAKQAIYRWRGGDLEQIVSLYRGTPEKLLANVPNDATRALLAQRYDALAGNLAPNTLRKNWRSRPEIVAFNNVFFGYVATRWSEQVPLLGQLYDGDFAQEVPTGRQVGPAGHVEIMRVPPKAPAVAYDVAAGTYCPDAPLPGHQPGDVLPYDEATLYRTLALIEKARADGFALTDLAVLCRTKSHSRAVAKLLKERGYPIISADSLALGFADAVNLLLNLLRVLHQPADGQARVAALLLFDKLVTHQPPAPARLQAIAALANPAEPARALWEMVSAGATHPFDPATAGNLGLYELAEQLVSALDLLAHAPAEAEYVFGLLDLTLEYSLRYGNNVGGFLDYWNQTGQHRAISTPQAGHDAITIQTVHKSKGLDYGVVIVPFADWPLRPRTGSLLWGTLPEEALPLPGMPPAAVVTHNQHLRLTALDAQYANEQTRTFVEVLNLLYVAFTRPRHRLYILTKELEIKEPAKKGAKADDPEKLPGTVGEVLHDFLGAHPTWQGAARWVVAQGAPAVPPKAADPGLAETPAETAVTDTSPWALTNLAATPWTERLQLKRHATTVFDFATQSRLREIDLKIHLALKRLASADELPRVLHELTAEGIIRGAEQPELRAALSALLAHPQLAPYFAPGAHAETENVLLLPAPAPGASSPPLDYQPDRIVFGPEAHAVALLDFRLPPADPQPPADQRHYAAQLRSLGYTQVTGVVYYLATGEVLTFSY